MDFISFRRVFLLFFLGNADVPFRQESGRVAGAMEQTVQRNDEKRNLTLHSFEIMRQGGEGGSIWTDGRGLGV